MRCIFDRGGKNSLFMLNLKAYGIENTILMMIYQRLKGKDFNLFETKLRNSWRMELCGF